METITVNSMSEMHNIFGMKPPKHPLITLFDWKDIDVSLIPRTKMRISLDFYMVSLKKLIKGSIKYGRNYYDFNEGTLVFIAPGQVFSSEDETEAEGWALFFHPDLSQKVKKNNFRNCRTDS